MALADCSGRNERRRSRSRTHGRSAAFGEWRARGQEVLRRDANISVSEESEPMSMPELRVAGGQDALVYAKPDHVPTLSTVLNF